MQAKQYWQQKLDSIDVIRQAGLLSWQVIDPGASNHIIKVKTGKGLWVVRINRAELGINRHQEKHIMDLIAPMGIGPRVIENNLESGYLITEFVDQPCWQAKHFQDPLMLEELITCMQQFHTIKYEYLPSRLDQRLKLYLKNIKSVNKTTHTELLNTIEQLEVSGFWQANTTLYHSDLNPNNLLGHKPLTVIDWEYAGQGHPLLDWLILEHETQIDLSAHYPSGINPDWLKPAKSLIQAMMSLWPHQSP